MICTEARRLLPALLYGHLPATEQQFLENHLSECADCREEAQALHGVRHLLDRLPTPPVEVNLARLYLRAAEEETRRARRWRRRTVLAAAAAVILVLVGSTLRLHARFRGNELVLAWGPVLEQKDPLPIESRAAPPASVPRSRASEEQQRNLETEVKLLGELIHALADDMQTLDRRQQQNHDQLQARLQSFEEQSAQRCSGMERSINALYLLTQKGE